MDCEKTVFWLDDYERSKGMTQKQLADVEDEWFITSNHSMDKEIFIAFVAVVAGDRIQLIRQYPEWNRQVRIPKRGHGRCYGMMTMLGKTR